MPIFVRRPNQHLVRGSWIALLLVSLMGVTSLSAQPAPKGKATQPPIKKGEEEDPAGKPPTKPVPRIEDETSKPNPATQEGPGVTPPPGVLVVGVQSLPTYMSPAFARTESERYALDLLFEGLLRPGLDPANGQIYEPQLAREMPALTPRGREFTLTDAVWSNGRPLTSSDIRSTLDKMRRRKQEPGAEAVNLIESDFAESQQKCRIVLARGHIDPLSVMTFKILPDNQRDDEAFAEKPIGSGPFVYQGRETKGGREYAIFPANPAYGRRVERANQPRLKEVWMVVSRNPLADVRGGLVHFVLTNHTGELATLKPDAKPADQGPRQTGKLEVNIGTTGRVDTLSSRRIYFLAINHKVPFLGGKAGLELRRILAHGIQRDAILDACFRAGFAEHHQPLNGPFLPGSWPCSPSAGPLDDADLARAKVRDLKESGRLGKLELQLKYPDGDPSVADACKMMAQQIADLKCGVTLVPKAVPASDYYRQIVLENDYQLAYWRYDYSDDWFNLTGLFDPAATGLGNRNFLGYQPPAIIQQLLARTQDRRDFSVVKRAMQQLHLALAEESPIIPLWHLDTHVLLSNALTTVPSTSRINPLAPFTDIEQWSLR